MMARHFRLIRSSLPTAEPVGIVVRDRHATILVLDRRLCGRKALMMALRLLTAHELAEAALDVIRGLGT